MVEQNTEGRNSHGLGQEDNFNFRTFPKVDESNLAFGKPCEMTRSSHCDDFSGHEATQARSPCGTVYSRLVSIST